MEAALNGLNGPSGTNGLSGLGGLKKKRVLCPVTHKDKTVWLRMGTCFENRDGSWNVYLDGLPVNGKLQIRDWEDGPWDSARRPGQEDRTESLPF